MLPLHLSFTSSLSNFEIFFSSIEKKIVAKVAATTTITQESTTGASMTSSTMVSSLERSLELAIHHSDGLSDKESKLKKAKSSFKIHRKTASVSKYKKDQKLLLKIL